MRYLVVHFGEDMPMNVQALTLDARRFCRGETGYDGPLAFIDLEATAEFPDPFELPPCPVLGLGDPSHPLASKLDGVIESRISADAIVRAVTAMPHAAAVTVQLLRILPSLAPDDGLTAESLAYAVLQGSDAHRAWIAERPDRGADGGVSNPRAVRAERNEDRLTIALDDPESGNAIDRTMRDALYEAFALAALDPEIHQVSLRGVGRTFSLGAELAEFGTTADPAAAHAIRALTLPARMIARCADKLDVHVQGGCVGAGLEMAAWARRFTATSDAWFQLPELAIGVLPGAGGCVSLTGRIGRQRTALLILSGQRIGARMALEWGLVDAIVDQPA